MRIGGIHVDLGMGTAQFEKGIKRAKKEADGLGASLRRSLGGIQREFAAGLGRGLIGGLAAGVSVKAAKDLIDQATKIENALKVAGLSGDALTKVYQRLFDAAQRNAAPIETLVELYSRAALQQKELGVSTEELLKFTDDVSIALRVAGTDARAASGALLQLSQALGSGTVRAEEFNSILEGAPTIAQAAAAGLKEAGGSVAKLRSLVIDGKVSSAAFFRAFEAGADTLRTKVAGAEMTVSQQFIRLQNVLVDVAGKFNTATGASATVGRGLERLADIVQAIGEVSAKVADGGLGKLIGKLTQAIDLMERFEPLSRAFSLITGDNIRGLGDFFSGGSGASPADALRSRIQQLQSDLTGLTDTAKGLGFDDSINAEIDRLEAELDKIYSGSGGPISRGGKRKATTVASKPVTLGDYPVTGDKKKKGTKERADEYERLTQRIFEAIAAQVAETEAQRQLNPLVEDYGYAAEKARTERELLTAAEKAGKTVTPALRAEIAALAEQYALAGAEAAKLAEEHGKAVEDMNFRKDLWLGVAKDFRAALADGKIEMQELGDIAISVLDRITPDVFTLEILK